MHDISESKLKCSLISPAVIDFSQINKKSRKRKSDYFSNMIRKTNYIHCFVIYLSFALFIGFRLFLLPDIIVTLSGTVIIILFSTIIKSPQNENVLFASQFGRTVIVLTVIKCQIHGKRFIIRIVNSFPKGKRHYHRSYCRFLPGSLPAIHSVIEGEFFYNIICIDGPGSILCPFCCACNHPVSQLLN